MNTSTMELYDLTYTKELVKDVPAPVLENLNRHPPEIISFKLKNASTAIANLLRICISFVPTKYLHCETEDIDTDQPFILDHVISRLACIPIMQTVTENTTVHINCKNTTNTSIYIYSKELKICINDNFRILQLDPGKYVKIKLTVKITKPKITTVDTTADIKKNVVNNFGFNKNFGISLLQAVLYYNILDYREIMFLHNDEIIKVFAKTKDVPEKKRALYYNDKKYDSIVKYFKQGESLSSDIQAEINKLEELYDEVIYKDGLEVFTTEQMYPTEFQLRFKTYGNISGKELLLKACNTVIDIIKNLHPDIDSGDTTDTSSITVITYEPIAVLIYDILKKLTNYKNVSMHITNIGYNNVIYKVPHEELFTKAVNESIAIFNKIISQIKQY